MRLLRMAVLLLIVFCSSCGLPGLSSPTTVPSTEPIILIATATPGALANPTEASALPLPTSPLPSPSSEVLATTAPADTPSAPNPVAAGAYLSDLRLSSATLLGIFRGQVTTWNDARIQADNPGLSLPELPITVIYRSDPSGTTRALTEYFVEVDPWWAKNIGAAYRLGDAGSANWPVGEGANGSSQIARTVRTDPGSISYVAPSYALEQGLPLATLTNGSGNWISPSSSSLRAAASTSADKLDSRLRGFIVNAPDQNAYPLALYTWILACPAQLRLEEGQALADFLYWSLTDAQAIASARQLGYEPLPASIRLRAIAQLAEIKIAGTNIFSIPATDTPFTPRSFSSPVAISGSGASFPGPLYVALTKRYQQLVPSVSISYDANGSTQGRIDLMQDGVVQFAGSEEAVADNDSQISQAACKPAPIHTPMVVGAVGIVYNLPQP